MLTFVAEVAGRNWLTYINQPLAQLLKTWVHEQAINQVSYNVANNVANLTDGLCTNVHCTHVIVVLVAVVIVAGLLKCVMWH